MTQFSVVTDYHPEYPDPIVLTEGDPLTIGCKYEGPEEWNDWYYCFANGKEGWVPDQIIKRIDESSGLAIEHYTARELDVRAGELLQGERLLNGWVWCTRYADNQSGWVPQENLESVNPVSFEQGAFEHSTSEQTSFDQAS